MVDTLKYTKDLQKAGLTREQAEKFAKANLNLFSEIMVTKEDLRAFQHCLMREIDSKVAVLATKDELDRKIRPLATKEKLKETESKIDNMAIQKATAEDISQFEQRMDETFSTITSQIINRLTIIIISSFVLFGIAKKIFDL